MSEQCNANLLKEIGLQNEKEAKSLMALLEKYFKATGGVNTTTSGILKNQMVNAVSKLKADQVSGDKVVAMLKQVQLSVGQDVRLIDILAAVLSAGKGNRFVNTFSRFKDVIYPSSSLEHLTQIKKIVRQVEGLNPLTIQKGIASQLAGKNTLTYNKTLLQSQFPEQFSTGMYKGDGVIEMGTDGKVADAVFLHSVFGIKDTMDILLKPHETDGYTKLDPMRVDKVVNEALDKLGVSRSLGDESVINTKLVTGWIHQLNEYLIYNQRLGIDIEWNPNYIVPNIHSQHELAITNLAKDWVTNLDMVDGAFPEDFNFDNEFELISRQGFTDTLFDLVDDELTMGKEWVSKRNAEPTKHDKYKEEKLGRIHDALMRSVKDTIIKDELDDLGENIVAGLPSATKAMSRRSLYWKSGHAYYTYLKKTNARVQDTYGLTKNPANPQGTVFMNMLTSDAEAKAKTLTMVQLLGTNPRQTLDKLKPKDENGKSITGDEIVGLLDNLVTKGEMQQYVFPANPHPFYGVPKETLKVVDQARNNAKFMGSTVGRSFDKLIAKGGNNSLNNTLWEHSYQSFLFANGLTKEVIKPLLPIINTLVDFTVVGHRIATLKTNTWALDGAAGNAFTLFSALNQFTMGKLKGEDRLTTMRKAIATGIGVDIKDLDNAEGLDSALAFLEATTTANNWMNITNGINGSKNATNTATNWVQSTMNKLNVLPPMELISFTLDTMSKAKIHQIVKNSIKEGSKSSVYWDYSLKQFGLNNKTIAAVDRAYGNVISEGQLGLIDVNKLLATYEGEYNAKNFREDFPEEADSFISGMRDIIMEAQMKEHNRNLKAEYAEQQLIHNDPNQAKPAIYNTLADFQTDTPEKYVLQNKDLDDQIAKKFIEAKASKVVSVIHDSADKVANRFLSKDLYTEIQASSTPAVRIANASFLYLKSFLIQYAERFARDIEDARAIGGGAEVANMLASQIPISIAAGLLYTTVTGLLNNREDGLLGLFSDVTDDSLTDEQKFGYSMGHLGQAAMIGHPILGFARTLSSLTGGYKDPWQTMGDFIVAPQLRNQIEILETVKKLSNYTARDFTEDTTTSQDETLRDNQWKAAKLAAKQIPIFNLFYMKALMNNAVYPEAQKFMGVASNAEKADKLREKSAEEGAANAFFNDPNTPIFQPNE